MEPVKKRQLTTKEIAFLLRIDANVRLLKEHSPDSWINVIYTNDAYRNFFYKLPKKNECGKVCIGPFFDKLSFVNYLEWEDMQKVFDLMEDFYNPPTKFAIEFRDNTEIIFRMTFFPR